MKQISVFLSVLMVVFSMQGVHAEEINQAAASIPSIPTGINAERKLAAEVKLAVKNDLLYSYITITQPVGVKGTIHLQWTPPEHSLCKRSDFSLPYDYKAYHTKAFRTLARVDKSGKRQLCSGTWQVKVLDAADNELAKADIDISNNA